MRTLLSHRIRYERDVVVARQRARQVAALVGFDVQDQTRLATAVSELARNAFEYARTSSYTSIYTDYHSCGYSQHGDRDR